MTDIFDFARLLVQDAAGVLTAVEILLRVTAILLLAMLVAVALRRSSAALRHWVWTLSLVGTLLLPLVYGGLPGWQWSVLPQRPATALPEVSPEETTDADTVLQQDALPQDMTQANELPLLHDAPQSEHLEVASMTPPAGEEFPAAPAAMVEPAAQAEHLGPAWSWPLLLAMVWAVGIIAGLVWLAVGVVGAWHVARHARTTADTRWSELLRPMLDAYGLRRPVAVRECPQVSVPMTWGLRRPVILVPVGSDSWSEATKRSVLLHELGHIRRGDCLTHLLGRLACAVYWFHPLVWLAAARLRKTSEQAADDVVLSSNIAPPDYAEHLVGIAAQMRGIHLFGHVALPMASPSDLTSRVQAILDPKRNRRGLKRKTCCVLIFLAVMVMIPCGVLRLGYAEDDSLAKDTVSSSNIDTKTDSTDGKVLDVDGNPQKPGHDLDGRPLPRGAVARLGSRRLRHEGWHKRIGMLPDNRTIISTAPGKGIRLWNADTGKMLRELDLQGESFSTMDLSRDGKFLATLSAKWHYEKREKTRTLRLWDTTMWKARPVATWVGSMGDDKCVAISPDAKKIALSQDRNSISFWDVESGKKLLDKKVAKHEIESIDFSPDGALVAIAAWDKTLIWKWNSGEEPKTLKPVVKRAQVAAFSPGGQFLAIGYDDEFAARIWDIESGKMLRRLKGKANSYYREGMEFSADGRSLIVPAKSAKAVEIFDVTSGRLLKSIDAGGLEPRDVAASSDGRLLASIGSNTAIKLWAMPEGKCLSDRFTGNADAQYEVAFTPDGCHVVTGSTVGTIRLWDADTGQQQRVLNSHNWVCGMAVSPDGKKVASCSNNKTLQLWNLESGREIYNLPAHGRLGGNSDYTVGFDRSGERLLSFGLDFYLRVWSTRTGKAMAEHAIRPSGIKLEETEDGTLILAGEAEQDPFGSEGIIDVTQQAMFNADGSRFFLGDKKHIYMFDVKSGREIDKFKLEDPLSTFHVSPEGDTLVTLENRRLMPDPKAKGIDAKMPRIVDFLRTIHLPSKRKIREIKLPAHTGMTMAFTTNERFAAIELHTREQMKVTSRWIGVWDLETGNEVARIDTYGEPVSRLAFSPDGRWLASSHRDTTVLVWDLEKFEVDEEKQD